MREHDRTIATVLILMLIIFSLGFQFHRSPDFAGSLLGGLLAVSGSLLMVLVTIGYLIVKRVKPINRYVTRFVRLRTVLLFHIYASLLGGILVILHTGHKFNSPLATALTIVTILVLLSGYAGHYLMQYCSQSLQEKREQLTQLEIQYRQVSGELVAAPEQLNLLRPFSGFFSQWIGSALVWSGQGEGSNPGHVVALSRMIADTEYAIKMHSIFKVALRWCLNLHMTLSFTFYLLLALHIWSGIYFGLRWFA